MKKITTFFFALLPLFVALLLFLCGFIVKFSTYVEVQSVELTDTSLVVQKPDEEHDKELTLTPVVLPMNATNPELFWTTSNEDILTVNDKGVVSCKNYGEAFVYAISKDNQTISASCKIEINDTEIHSVVVSDQDRYDVGYVGLNERKTIKTSIIPATGVLDPTVDYEVDDQYKSYLSVTSDGLILPEKQTPAGTKAKIKIHPHSGNYKERVTEIEVQIGPGVEQLCLKDSTESITSSDTYDVYSQLNTYPEKNVDKTDFIYVSSDESIATIDENGIATFVKPGDVKFNATYKRNEAKSVSKSVSSTCNYIVNANFNCESYTQNIKYENGKYIPQELDKVNCDVYPKSTSNESKYQVISSDESIVQTIKNEDGSYKFNALRPGCVMLFVIAKSSQNKINDAVDACNITITSLDETGKDLGFIKNNQVALESGIYYYPLINSLNLQSDYRCPYEISYQTDSSIASIDENGILHFTSSGTANVAVLINGKETGLIQVTSSDNIIDLDVENKIVVNVGQRYRFKNATPIFESKEYKDYFDVDSNNVWVAKNGCNITDFEITTNNAETKTINLIVKENPIYINNPKNVYFSTEANQYNYKKDGGIKIVPSTATKEDGTKYNLNFSYKFSNDSIKVEDDNITFSSCGIAQVTTTCDELQLSLDSWFKSTFGKMDKFTIKDEQGQVIKSNQDITYSGSPLIYKITDLSLTQAEQINHQIMSEGKLADVKKEIIEQETDKYTVQFTITSKSNLYGTEIIGFTTGVYIVYLNVIFPSVVTDVEIKYGRETLSCVDTITSYINELTLDIIPYPALPNITESSDAYSVKLNDQPIEVVDNKVSIDLTKGNILKIYAKGSAQPLKTYTFHYETDYTKLKISMIGADEENNVYMGAKETKKVLYLKTNGLVPTDFFQTDKFKVELDGTHGELAQMQQDILTISNIPSPDGNLYSIGMELSYSGVKIANFLLTRDIVNKIILPKHNNEDMTDKKGLQKVHVYGNRSYYDPNEKSIEGYRLPIEIYDYKGDLIVNTVEKPDLKEQAIKTLDLKIDKNCSCQYDDINDCVTIKFANDTLYNEDEIAQNLFDSEDGAKNVTFVASNKSVTTNAKYTFVPVEGTNVYCQEGLQELDTGSKEHGKCAAVLQTNFGEIGLEKENVKFEINIDSIGGIYGNGYTMCSVYQTENLFSSFHLGFHFAFNVTFKGTSDESFEKLASDTIHKITIRNMDYYKSAYFMYSIYKNFCNGMGYDLLDPTPIKIKNSLFYKDKVSNLVTNQEHGDAYLENCVFFNCGGLPLTILNGGMHFKGYIGIYNFHNKEAFYDIFGKDLSALWPEAEYAAKKAKMTEVGADGRLYINFFMVNAMTKKFYFWNSKTQEYEQDEKGNPDAANFIAKFVDISIPFTSINASMWATYNREVDPASFSYFDEYDSQGQIRIDFLSNQINKLVRQPIYF